MLERSFLRVVAGAGPAGIFCAGTGLLPGFLLFGAPCLTTAQDEPVDGYERVELCLRRGAGAGVVDDAGLLIVLAFDVRSRDLELAYLPARNLLELGLPAFNRPGYQQEYESVPGFFERVATIHASIIGGDDNLW